MTIQAQNDLRGALEQAVRTLKFLNSRASIGTVRLASLTGLADIIADCENALQGGK